MLFVRPLLPSLWTLPTPTCPFAAWLHGDTDFVSPYESIRTAIHTFSYLCPDDKEEEVPSTLVYIALKMGTAERVARSAGAWRVPGDLHGRRVAVG